MRKYVIPILIVLISLLTSCNPYDTNTVNKRLIQGEWVQKKLLYPMGNEIVSETAENKTLLIFRADTCIENMEDLESSISYIFDIKDYVISLKNDSAIINHLVIHKLTEDSLILRTNNKILKYTKKQVAILP